MRRSLLIILILFWAASALAQKPATAQKTAAPKGRNIHITLTPLRNCKVYLGSYFGSTKTTLLMDSANLDGESKGVFRGDTKLTPGIYFVVSPQRTLLFDLLMDAHQQFSISGDTALKDKVVITGSADNDLYKQYAATTAEKGRNVTQLEARYHAARTKQDSSLVLAEVIKANKDLQDYRAGISRQHPNSLLAMLLNAMKRPEAPPVPVRNGKPDSLYPYRYVKDHYWDDVAFNDDRLLRTPFFEPKLDDYFRNLVSPDPDSIIAEVKYILLSARTGKEMYPFLLTKFTNKYINPEYMGQDKVFLYLFEDFYAKGDTVLLNADSRKSIRERAYSLMANQLGQMAPALDLTDTSGAATSLYSVNAPFTVVAFWDPNCGHCKEEIPRLDSIYKAKWKGYGIKVYSVDIYDNNLPEWKRFMKEKSLSPDWIQAYETKAAKTAVESAGKPNYRQLYDIYKTPTLYLLDKDKRIIAKQLSLSQFDDLIETKRKKG